ncbi:hypothetical protein SBA3_1690019 [Candidatus Sulfopaludibacter sp. SbA3]|nr:hypothetical protein SBA3_1690019 [Candidatus Sulfopaludibacter sp. SbA3]
MARLLTKSDTLAGYIDQAGGPLGADFLLSSLAAFVLHRGGSAFALGPLGAAILSPEPSNRECSMR